MNTAQGRLLLIGRDASSAANALTNLHRCLAKLKRRAESLGTNPNTAAYVTAYLGNAESNLGITLGFLDRVVADIEAERKRRIAERRAVREAVKKEIESERQRA